MSDLVIGILIGVFLTFAVIFFIVFIACCSSNKEETYEEYRVRMYPPGM